MYVATLTRDSERMTYTDEDPDKAFSRARFMLDRSGEVRRWTIEVRDFSNKVVRQAASHPPRRRPK